MKVAVSIPDPLFAQADALARRLKLSRSKVYAQALDAFLADHDGDRLTEAMDAAIDAAGEEGPDPFVHEAGRRILKKLEW